MRRKIINLAMVFFILSATLALNTKNVSADNISSSDLISLVNGIRTGSYGLPALLVDPILMAHAQWTAQTMADYGIHGHLADNGYAKVSVRVAGAGYGSGSTVWATENWAGGSTAFRTLANIQTDWSDAAHMYPMVKDYYTGIGAGVAVDASGYAIYIVIAAYTSGGSSSGSSSVSTSSVAAATSDLTNYVQPVITATPDGDGNIYHVVQYGQSLSAIATWYGVTVAKIKELNTLTSDAIYEGNKLLISIKPTVTITPTRTATVPQPTRTQSATSVPPTPRPTLTATPTPKPSLGSAMAKIDRQYLGLGILAISAIGFLIVLFSSFLKPIAKK